MISESSSVGTREIHWDECCLVLVTVKSNFNEQVTLSPTGYFRVVYFFGPSREEPAADYCESVLGVLVVALASARKATTAKTFFCACALAPLSLIS